MTRILHDGLWNQNWGNPFVYPWIRTRHGRYSESHLPLRDHVLDPWGRRKTGNGMWAAGFRYGRSARRRLLGTPDFVFPGLGAVVFVHGCFWHGHECDLGRVPKTNPEFWVAQIPD